MSLRNSPLEEVREFTYPVSVIDSDGGTEADIRSRIGKARVAFAQLKKVWKSTQIKIKTFNSNVKSVLLYGAETWKTTGGIMKRLQTFINGCLRRILKLKWQDKVKNEEVWERAGIDPIETTIGKRKWRWIGHTLRKPATNTTRQALHWNPQGKRSQGRPRDSWRRGVERDRARLGVSWTELGKIAKDKERWRSLVCDLYPGIG